MSEIRVLERAKQDAMIRGKYNMNWGEEDEENLENTKVFGDKEENWSLFAENENTKDNVQVHLL